MSEVIYDRLALKSPYRCRRLMIIHCPVLGDAGDGTPGKRVRVGVGMGVHRNPTLTPSPATVRGCRGGGGGPARSRSPTPHEKCVCRRAPQLEAGYVNPVAETTTTKPFLLSPFSSDTNSRLSSGGVNWVIGRL